MKLSILLLVGCSFVLTSTYGQNTPWSTTGNIGIGTTSPQTKLEVTDTTTAAKLESTGGANNGSITVLGLRKTTSGVMADGFGASLSFYNRDNNAIDNRVGFIATLRSGADNSGAMSFNTANAGALTEKMRITNTGNVGIGITPVYKLDIFKNVNESLPLLNIRNSSTGISAQTRINFFSNTGTGLAVNGACVSLLGSNYSSGLGNCFQIWNYENGFMRFGTHNLERMRITDAGDIAIGTIDSKGYRLAVNGNAIFTKVKVKQYDSWPDYVFDSAYQLPSLKETENYVRAHKHLAGVPSAAEVEKEGLDLGGNQAALLKKIEELTLYIIEQNKEIDQQKRDKEQLLNRLSKIEDQLNLVETIIHINKL